MDANGQAQIVDFPRAWPRVRYDRRDGVHILPIHQRFLLAVLLLQGCGSESEVASLAQRARVLSAASVDGTGERHLVAITGVLSEEAPVGDPGLLLPGRYIEIRRRVEMFAWCEVQLGSGAYRYDLRFDEDPPATVEFHRPEGHENPPVPLRSDLFCAPSARVGAYPFQPCRAQLLLGEPLPVSPALLERDDRRQQLREGLLYLGRGTPESPRLGDLRISYTVVRAGQEVTALGEQRDGELVPGYGRAGSRLYHVLKPGTVLTK